MGLLSNGWMLLFGTDLLCEKIAEPGGVLVRFISAE